MLHLPDLLETSRLRLRRIRQDDALDIFTNYASHPAVSRYMTWPQQRQVADCEAYTKAASAAWDLGKAFHFVVVEKVSEAVIGGCGVEPFPGGHSGHVHFGYCFQPSSWGKGYATETTGALLRWFSGTSDIQRISAFVDVANLASAKVLEKSGFVCEGRLRKWAIHPNISLEPRDVFLYSYVDPAEA